MQRTLLALIVLFPSLALAGGPPGEVAIYPGFSKDELPASLQAVTNAAKTCIRHGEALDEPQTGAAIAPHLAAEVVDGIAVELQQSQVDIDCGTKPLRRCTFTHVWAKGSDQVGFGSIQCLGSHEDAYTSYLATAAFDLRKAKKPGVLGTRKDKAIVLTSLTFQTDAFPGSHITAFVARKRVDGSTEEPPQVMQFDDFAQTDNASGALTGDEMARLSKAIVGLTCRATEHCERSAPGRPTAQLR